MECTGQCRCIGKCGDRKGHQQPGSGYERRAGRQYIQRYPCAEGGIRKATSGRGAAGRTIRRRKDDQYQLQYGGKPLLSDHQGQRYGRQITKGSQICDHRRMETVFVGWCHYLGWSGMEYDLLSV